MGKNIRLNSKIKGFILILNYDFFGQNWNQQNKFYNQIFKCVLALHWKTVFITNILLLKNQTLFSSPNVEFK